MTLTDLCRAIQALAGISDELLAAELAKFTAND